MLKWNNDIDVEQAFLDACEKNNIVFKEKHDPSCPVEIIDYNGTAQTLKAPKTRRKSLRGHFKGKKLETIASPVISTSTGYKAAIVDDGGNGYYVDILNHDCFKNLSAVVPSSFKVCETKGATPALGFSKSSIKAAGKKSKIVANDANRGLAK